MIVPAIQDVAGFCTQRVNVMCLGTWFERYKYMLGQRCPNANINIGLRAGGLPAEAVKHE